MKKPREPEEDRYRRRRNITDHVLEDRYRRRRSTMDDVLEDKYRRRRSTMDDGLEDFCDRCSSSSRKRSRTSEKTYKTTTVKSKRIYMGRHTISREGTYDEVRSRSSTTATEFDRFEKFWEEIDHDELRRRRKRDRKAARVAVDGIRNTAGFENNRDAVKELESICECSAYYVLGRNPLISLALFLKPEYSDINDEDEEAVLFGNTHCTKKPYVRMVRSMQHKVEKEEHVAENIKHYDRVEMLKLRYKDTILKTQKALGLPADYSKQQGTGLKTTEVRSWSTTTTEFDQFEKFWEEIDRDHLRRRRERDREAARVAVDGIRETAYLENNRDAVKELESMCECSSYYVLGRNPLINLGLFLKPEYSNINDEDEEAVLFGDIHRTKKPYIHKGRPMQHKVEKQEYGTENTKHYSNGTIEANRSCGYATSSSPRKDHDRVEMLKLRYKDTILKAQKALGLPEYEKQEGVGLKTSSRRKQDCKNKGTIKAPIRGATHA